MKKILHIIPGIYYGGVESFILRHIEGSEYSHTVTTLSSISTDQISEFERINIKVLLNKSDGKFKKYLYLLKAIKSDRFDYIHIHLNELTWVAVLLIKCNWVNTKIVIHSHNFFDKKFETRIVKFNNFFSKVLIKRVKSLNLACSLEAGKWLFGKSKFSVVKNAFAIEEYRTSKNEYGNQVGFIGRLEKQKQPIKAVKIFEKYFIDTHKLIMIGSGSYLKKLVNFIDENDLVKKVKLAPPQANIVNKLKDIDILVAPSLFEGLGIIIVEAFASGCKIIISEAFPDEIKLLPGIIILEDNDEISIHDREKLFAELSNDSRGVASERNIKHLRRLNYDIEEQNFEKIYK
ncbi:glycosyltransferase [Thalassomonas sp. M1454]|uniref:glycosyltransferase n=1 Tax=Thalassomonas sp. M1454 TaxID=2594477 RepID=UPI00117F64C4|nr:glycosyltransferase [Thalassomonas sp. M1454]TRX57195.1 glycosyltransferase family 1 protein [Thalassomonas sp. M1454]